MAAVAPRRKEPVMTISPADYVASASVVLAMRGAGDHTGAASGSAADAGPASGSSSRALKTTFVPLINNANALLHRIAASRARTGASSPSNTHPDHNNNFNYFLAPRAGGARLSRRWG